MHVLRLLVLAWLHYPQVFSNELRLRREQYAAQVEEALSNGKIDKEEKIELAKTRLSLGIDNNDAANIEKRVDQNKTCPH